jgi:hypothetical protein
MVADGEFIESLTIDALELPPTALAMEPVYRRFLDANPTASIEEMALHSGKAIAVKNPWGDPSVAITLPPSSPQLEDALNNVFLPERYTAIWHRDTKDLEIIWTANPLPPQWIEIYGRNFSFSWKGREFHCDFSISSERLLVIAEHFEPVISTSTSFRNLMSFNMFTEMRKNNDIAPSIEPRSFWIRDIDWNEDDVLDIANHINFYMTYYDAQSPTIVIHTAKSENKASRPRTRYTAGEFPSKLDFRSLDDTLLSLWTACHEGDAARRFLYGFRVIEYASYSFLDGSARKEIRRLLSAPNRLNDLDSLSESLASALQKSKGDEHARFEALLHDTVPTSLLWREIQNNTEAFTSDTVFDGGFKINKLLASGSREEDFSPNAILVFHKAIRSIRNALAHGKEQRTALVITPTIRNFERLSPWATLVLAAASEVVLYKDVV